MSWLFKSRKEKKQSDQIAKNMVRQISESFESAGKPISPEEYSQIRQREIEWLETHYDLSSAAGIASIPNVPVCLAHLLAVSPETLTTIFETKAGNMKTTEILNLRFFVSKNRTPSAWPADQAIEKVIIIVLFVY